MELMIQCCLMNGYCPYNTPIDIYLMSIAIMLLLFILIETIRK